MRKLIKAVVASALLVAVLWASGVAPAAYNLILDEAGALVRRSTLNFVGLGVTCVDDAGNARTNCTIPGGGVTYISSAGGPAYREDFIAANTITVTDAQHGFHSSNLQVACYDNAAPAALFEPVSVTIDGTTFQVVVTFSAPTTGYCTIQGGGAVACTAYNIVYTNAAFQAASTDAEIGLFTLAQLGKVTGVTIKHATQFSDGGGAMTDVSVSVGNAVAPYTQYAAASSIGEVTPVADTTFYDTAGFRSTTMAAAGGTVSAHFIATGRNFGDGAGNTFLTGGAVMIWVCTTRIN
jgi:hypothetical protein